MKFTKKKTKTIIDEGNKEKEEENTPSQEDVEAAKDMLAAMMGPPEEEMPSTFMLYGDVNEERASDIVSALLLLGDKKRVDKAKEREVYRIQPLEESLKELGFDPHGLGKEERKDKKVVGGYTFFLKYSRLVRMSLLRAPWYEKDASATS